MRTHLPDDGMPDRPSTAEGAEPAAVTTAHDGPRPGVPALDRARAARRPHAVPAARTRPVAPVIPVIPETGRGTRAVTSITGGVRRRARTATRVFPGFAA
ncbi:hypothetical protein [Streptomyces sp. NPDC014894]|uniref:hypothetical protein n=1 Tax=Streptomyces sp. NPDC014894 TaxID=3364931 RepID=UPI0036F83072